MAAAMASCAAAALEFDAGEYAVAADRALTAAVGLEEINDVYDAVMARRLGARALALVGDSDAAAAEFERVPVSRKLERQRERSAAAGAFRPPNRRFARET